MVALLSDDDVGADEIREVCESQEDSCKIEVCREGKVGEVESSDVCAKVLVACQARPV